MDGRVQLAWAVAVLSPLSDQITFLGQEGDPVAGLVGDNQVLVAKTTAALLTVPIGDLSN